MISGLEDIFLFASRRRAILFFNQIQIIVETRSDTHVDSQQLALAPKSDAIEDACLDT